MASNEFGSIGDSLGSNLAETDSDKTPVGSYGYVTVYDDGTTNMDQQTSKNGKTTTQASSSEPDYI